MKTILIIGFLSLQQIMFAQQSELDLEDFVEKIYQIQDEDLPYDQIYESLLQYYIHPINLNKTNPEQLLSLHILTPAQVNDFFLHLNKNGDLLSIFELQAIPSFTPEIIRDLLPFVSVNEIYDQRKLWKRIISEENNYLLLRHYRTLENRKGFQTQDENRYLGDPNYLYARYRISRSNDFSFGFTLEKDPGEQLTINKSTSQYLFDYTSFHLYLKNKRFIKTLAIGDYQLQLGQGLVFGSGFSFGKGAETINTIRRNEIGIRPYTSSLESGFFRGTGISLGNKRWTTTLIYSSNSQDARVQNDSTYADFEEYISSIQSSGYHRNNSEIAARRQINEQAFGSGVSYKLRQLTIGSTFLYNQFSLPVIKKPNNYNQFEFKGNHNWVGSIYGSLLWQNLNLFSELARSASGGQAFYGGVIASLTPKLDFSFSLRNYEKDFHSFYANGFGENSRTINEKGVYWGLKLKPLNKLELVAYFDYFEFPWLKFRVDAPSNGQEVLGRITYRVSREIQLYAQYQQEAKEISISTEANNFSILKKRFKESMIFNADYKIAEGLIMKTRVQTSKMQLNGNTTSGFAIIQDVGYSFWRLRFDARVAVFDTDNYDNRIYTYEKDLLYTFSIPAYAGNGLRSYFMLRYKINRILSLWIKYARFSYPYQSTIGSGLNEINEPVRSDIKTMLKINF